ncbi:MAG: glutamate--tRNA ligase, partial [Deltaproteobacteria bacterium]|nr:glutamate--tRNA ligase [Deltaproteobacteria bacterium]
TDAARSKEEHTKAILSSLAWLGLNWDGEPVFQSERADLHRQRVLGLVAEGRAYWCHCRPEDIEEKRQAALKAGGKPRYDGHCRDLGLGPAPGAVVRFKSPPAKAVAWLDLIKGPIEVNSGELDDLVLLKSDGNPTYNLAVVVDDLTMGVTHVIRGDDHVNNTPRQILLYEALGAQTPQFGHVPMILGQDKARLSKRHGATSVEAYREMGYLPKALVNYLARLGWSHGDQEIFSLPEMVELFSLKKVGKSAAVFNLEKLNWLNAHYIKETSLNELGALILPYLKAKGLADPEPAPELLAKIAATVRERGKTLAELAEKAEFYFLDPPPLDPLEAKKVLNQAGVEILSHIQAAFSADFPATRESFDRLVQVLAAEKNLKMGAVAKPLRLALTGKTASPGLWEILEILGQAKTLARVEAAMSSTGGPET